MTQPLRVGIVGLSAGGGWAAASHLPALHAVEGIELRAVVGSTPHSGQATAAAYGVRSHPDVEQLAADDEVDLVVVAVKARDHLQSALPALAAGKAVYCEWPLGNGTAEARAMTAAASGLRTVVGLQSRCAPALQFVRDLIADGYVGEVLSTTLVASAGAWGPTFPARGAHELDPDAGNHMLAVAGGHLLDGLAHCLGEFEHFDVTMANRLPLVRERETGRTVEKRVDDQIVVSGRLAGGAVAAVHLRGGSSRVSGLTFEINGTDGDLLVTTDSGYLHLGRIRIRGARGDDPAADLPVPEHYRKVPHLPSDSPAYNVAHTYAQFVADIASDTEATPNFEHGLRRHIALDAIAAAARRHDNQITRRQHGQ